jgi:hypothetical protein
MPMKFHRPAITLVVTLGLLLGVAVSGTAVSARTPAAATSPAGDANTRWGWVTARHKSGTYVPAARDQGNSTGGTNTVLAESGGGYEVRLGGLGVLKGVDGFEGVAHVTALGKTAHTCDTVFWADDGGDEQLLVQCYDAAGHPANSKFTLTFTARTGAGGKLGYVTADQPTQSSYVPTNSTSYNSTGGTNHVTRSGVGDYRVKLPGLAGSRGTVQVTGQTGKTGVDVVCNAVSWGPSSSAEIVDVTCRNNLGAAVDAPFSVSYLWHAGLKGVGAPKVAYLRDDQKKASVFTPAAAYRYSLPSGALTVRRNGTGVYVATLSAMPLGGTAVLTPLGSGKRRCMVGGIQTVAKPQRVTVRCFTDSGSPSNAKFTLAYER